MTDDLIRAEMQEDDSGTPIPLNPFAELTREKGTWDRGVDYRKAKLFFEHKIRTEKGSNKEALTRYSNWAALLIQLTNGARISEATEAFNVFLETGNRDLKIRVRKKKNKEDLRRILIPSVIRQWGSTRTVDAVKIFARRYGGINTHSLRYALVGYLSSVKKVPPQIIAKLTHHSNMDMILKYTQQRTADEILDETAR
jgi:hypothetical protein